MVKDWQEGKASAHCPACQAKLEFGQLVCFRSCGAAFVFAVSAPEEEDKSVQVAAPARLGIFARDELERVHLQPAVLVPQSAQFVSPLSVFSHVGSRQATAAAAKGPPADVI